VSSSTCPVISTDQEAGSLIDAAESGCNLVLEHIKHSKTFACKLRSDSDVSIMISSVRDQSSTTAQRALAACSTAARSYMEWPPLPADPYIETVAFLSKAAPNTQWLGNISNVTRAAHADLSGADDESQLGALCVVQRSTIAASLSLQERILHDHQASCTMVDRLRTELTAAWENQMKWEAAAFDESLMNDQLYTKNAELRQLADRWKKRALASEQRLANTNASTTRDSQQEVSSGVGDARRLSGWWCRLCCSVQAVCHERVVSHICVAVLGCAAAAGCFAAGRPLMGRDARRRRSATHMTLRSRE
jgi:hypothetical protein